MKHHKVTQENRYPFWLKATIILFGISLLIILLVYGKFILMPLFFAAFFSFLVAPMVNRLEKWKLGRAGSILLSMLLVIIVLSGIISLVSVQFVQFAEEIPEVTERLKTITNDSIDFVEGRLGITQEQQSDFIQKGLNNIIEKSGQYARSAVGATTNIFTNLTLLPIFMFFLLYYRGMYETFFYRLFDNSSNESIDDLIDRIEDVTQNYIVGMLTVVGILAVLNTTGLLIIGLENAIFFGVFAALIAIIPYIGTLIGGLLPTIYAFLFTDSLLMPLAVIIVFGIVQFLEGNLITPRIVGSKVAINPFMAMLALIVGAEIWGISGMILFVPLIGILRVIFEQIEGLKPYGYLLGNSIEYKE